MKIICPVDASGKFTSDVSDFKGQYVKVIYKPNTIKLMYSLNNFLNLFAHFESMLIHDSIYDQKQYITKYKESK